MDSELLTVPEAAALLRLKPSTIRAWVCQRKIPFVKLGRLVRIKRSDAEQFAGAFAVAARDDRRVDVNEPAFLEKLVNGEREPAPDAKNRAEQVRPRPQMRNLAEKLRRVSFFLEWI